MSQITMVRNIYRRLRKLGEALDNIQEERHTIAVKREKFFDPLYGRTYCKVTNLATHRYWWERVES